MDRIILLPSSTVDTITAHTNTILVIRESIEKDLKRGINNILLFIVPLQKQKNPEDFNSHLISLIGEEKFPIREIGWLRISSGNLQEFYLRF